MTTGAQITAERAKRDIPFRYLEAFEDMTNDALFSLGNDTKMAAPDRIYARAELAYREAFGIVVDFDENDRLRRREFLDDVELERAFAEDKKRRDEKPKIDRSRWSLDSARDRIRRQMAEASS